ncbi:hypothetical protein K8R62_03265 [bacterium]|nr:hypothetical protein [bacterium]
MAKKSKFSKEPWYEDKDKGKENIYSEEGIEAQEDEDAISPEEEGFMQGYTKEEKKKKKK